MNPPSARLDRSLAGGLPRAAAPAQWTAATLAALLAAAAVLVAWRRLAGALTAPLPGAWLATLGLLAAALAAGVRVAWRRAATSHSAAGRRLMQLGPAAALLALAAAVSLPGTAALGLIGLWGCLAVEEAWAWRCAVRSPRQRPPSTAPPSAPEATVEMLEPKATVAEAAPPLPPEAVPSPIDEDHLPGDEVLQQLTRSQAADGGEQLVGWLRAPFAPGQRTASVHVAFCPPFARTPELSVRQCDGPRSRIKTAQLLPHGVRLDLKLAAAAAAADRVLLLVTAAAQREE